MKKFFLGAAVIGLFTGYASAADLPTKAPPLAPAPVIAPSWTGFYIGINGGVAWTDPSMAYSDFAPSGYLPVSFRASDTSGIIGLHLGYNYQFAPNWVIGIEGDFDWTNLKAAGTQGLVCAGTGHFQCGGVNLAFTDNANLQTETNWLASVRGRLGYTWNNQWLVYGTGGIAFGNFDFNAQVNCTNVPPSFCIGISQSINTHSSDTRTGWVAGGGVEYKFTRNWNFGIEYLYYDFNSASTTGSWVFQTGAPAPFFECTTPGQTCAKFSYDKLAIQTTRLRLSYQF